MASELENNSFFSVIGRDKKWKIEHERTKQSTKYPQRYLLPGRS